MSSDSRTYCRTLGAHIALLRKSRGMTQAELARVIGVSQQAVFAYEPRRAARLGIHSGSAGQGVRTGVEELMGISRPVRISKRRLSPRAMRHAKRLQALSKNQQRFIIRIIDLLEAINSRRATLVRCTRF